MKIVILKNMLGLEDPKQYENFFTELEEDLRLECEMKCGPIQRIKIFEVNETLFILLDF